MFYIIEKLEQLPSLKNLGDCFIDFIPFNDNIRYKIFGDPLVGIKKNIYASFDIYYFNGVNLTSLPLIDEKEKYSILPYGTYGKEWNKNIGFNSQNNLTTFLYKDWEKKYLWGLLKFKPWLEGLQAFHLVRSDLFAF